MDAIGLRVRVVDVATRALAGLPAKGDTGVGLEDHTETAAGFPALLADDYI
jgi:hypothetical protein